MAALLLAAGAAGKRYALPNCRILIHQPFMSGLSGQATDIDIHAKEILRLKEITCEILCRHTKQPMEKILRDVERDYIMGADEAVAYGLIDKVITKQGL